MLAVHLVDTPKRTALNIHATTLRTKLKDWEKSFAVSHSGQKPGKEDIKACLEISETYREYNRIRDVLAGRLGVERLNDIARWSPTTIKSRRRRKERDNTTDTETKRESTNTSVARAAKGSPGSRWSPRQPNEFDAYDHPISSSPRPYLVTAIGPTPQRDGKALGLFDLLSKSANSSQATPSTRKRKVDRLSDVVKQDTGVRSELAVSQTPSRKRMRSADIGRDILDQIDCDSPMGKHRHSRTPSSEGRKFMLSQFFATPSTMRLAAIGEDQGDLHHSQRKDQDTGAEQTPLRKHVLGNRASRTTEIEMPALDTTPTYLKRSYSFKDRLLSASASATGTVHSLKMNASSPISTQSGPPTLRRYRSGPKPLSEIMRGLRQMDDERHDDDLNALREIESGQINVRAVNCQAVEFGAVALEGDVEQEVRAGYEKDAPPKMWKKKGQKRTTKHTNMRPAKMKPKKENQWVAEDSESGTDDEHEVAEEAQYGIKQTPATGAHGRGNPPECDLLTTTRRGVQYFDETAGQVKQRTSGSGAGFEDENNHDDFDEPEKPPQSKAGGKKIRTIHFNGEATKSPGRKGKGFNQNNADKVEYKRGPTINPNAVSHQNFRSLKIRNKNSKGKGGRGLFARKGR